MLLEDILCEWRLVKDYFECELFWVSGGGYGIILGGWVIILGGWKWVGKYFGWVGVDGLSSGEYAGCTV